MGRRRNVATASMTIATASSMVKPRGHGARRVPRVRPARPLGTASVNGPVSRSATEPVAISTATAITAGRVVAPAEREVDARVGAASVSRELSPARAPASTPSRTPSTVVRARTCVCRERFVSLAAARAPEAARCVRRRASTPSRTRCTAGRARMSARRVQPARRGGACVAAAASCAPGAALTPPAIDRTAAPAGCRVRQAMSAAGVGVSARRPRLFVAGAASA